MDIIYNTLCITDKGLEDFVIKEIEYILNKEIEYKKIENKNKIFIFFNSDFYERLKLLYLSRTIDNILYYDKNEYSYKHFLIKNLYKRGYEVKKINKIKSTIISKILYYSNIQNSQQIINLMDDGSFSIEEGIFLRNIPPLFWRKKEIIDYIDYLEKIENINNNIETKIYCINKDTNILYNIEKNAEKAIVRNNIYFRRIDLEWLNLKFKENSIDIIYTFRIKKGNINIKDKYIFYQSDKLLKKGGKLFLLLYNNEHKYDELINNIVSYIDRYDLELLDKIILYNNDKMLVLLSIQKV